MGLFKKAVKSDAKLRLAIAGPSGSGKTYTSLAIATGLGGPIAVVDTEHGSASKYADLFNFDVLEMGAPYHPDKYIQAIREAASAGYKVIILDSLSHAWNGEGGILSLVEEAGARMKSNNSFAAWKDVTPIQNRFIEAIVAANIHIIGTMRSKQEYVQEKNDRGYTSIRKVGMAPVQRDGFEYEFDVVFDMDVDNRAIVTKTRCPELTGKVIEKPGAQVASTLKAWLVGAPKPAQDKPERKPSPPPAEDVDFGMGKNGNGQRDNNPFEEQPEESQPATTEELAQIEQWANRTEAEMWAVMIGACENEFEAKNSLDKSVTAHGGKATKANIQAIYLHFLRRQMEKLAQQPETA